MRPGPPPPPLPASLDLNPSARTVAKFRDLVAKGRQRHTALLAAARGIAPAERERRTLSFAEHYRTVPAVAPYEQPLAVVTRVEGFPEAITYINAPDPEHHEIRAYHNVSPEAGIPVPAWFLKSSDVLYFQYRAKAQGEPPPLRSVQRRNVASGTGNTVMTCALALFGEDLFGMELRPDDPSAARTADYGPDRVLTASPADLYFAWLGTENGVSSIWLVRDHGELLGASALTHIVVNSGQNITIHLA